MSDHEHEERGHHRDHQAHSQAGRPAPDRSGLHKDWRVWLVVGLMLAAMAIYLLTMDEALRPGGKLQEAVPAADAP